MATETHIPDFLHSKKVEKEDDVLSSDIMEEKVKQLEISSQVAETVNTQLETSISTNESGTFFQALSVPSKEDIEDKAVDFQETSEKCENVEKNLEESVNKKETSSEKVEYEEEVKHSDSSNIEINEKTTTFSKNEDQERKENDVTSSQDAAFEERLQEKTHHSEGNEPEVVKIIESTGEDNEETTFQHATTVGYFEGQALNAAPKDILKEEVENKTIDPQEEKIEQEPEESVNKTIQSCSEVKQEEEGIEVLQQSVETEEKTEHLQTVTTDDCIKSQTESQVEYKDEVKEVTNENEIANKVEDQEKGEKVCVSGKGEDISEETTIDQHVSTLVDFKEGQDPSSITKEIIKEEAEEKSNDAQEASEQCENGVKDKIEQNTSSGVETKENEEKIHEEAIVSKEDNEEKEHERNMSEEDKSVDAQESSQKCEKEAEQNPEGSVNEIVQPYSKTEQEEDTEGLLHAATTDDVITAQTESQVESAGNEVKSKEDNQIDDSQKESFDSPTVKEVCEETGLQKVEYNEKPIDAQEASEQYENEAKYKIEQNISSSICETKENEEKIDEEAIVNDDGQTNKSESPVVKEVCEATGSQKAESELNENEIARKEGNEENEQDVKMSEEVECGGDDIVISSQNASTEEGRDQSAVSKEILKEEEDGKTIDAQEASQKCDDGTQDKREQKPEEIVNKTVQSLSEIEQEEYTEETKPSEEAGPEKIEYKEEEKHSASSNTETMVKEVCEETAESEEGLKLSHSLNIGLNENEIASKVEDEETEEAEDKSSDAQEAGEQYESGANETIEQKPEESVNKNENTEEIKPSVETDEKDQVKITGNKEDAIESDDGQKEHSIKEVCEETHSEKVKFEGVEVSDKDEDQEREQEHIILEEDQGKDDVTCLQDATSIEDLPETKYDGEDKELEFVKPRESIEVDIEEIKSSVETKDDKKIDEEVVVNDDGETKKSESPLANEIVSKEENQEKEQELKMLEEIKPSVETESQVKSGEHDVKIGKPIQSDDGQKENVDSSPVNEVCEETGSEKFEYSEEVKETTNEKEIESKVESEEGVKGIETFKDEDQQKDQVDMSLEDQGEDNVTSSHVVVSEDDLQKKNYQEKGKEPEFVKTRESIEEDAEEIESSIETKEHMEQQGLLHVITTDVCSSTQTEAMENEEKIEEMAIVNDDGQTDKSESPLVKEVCEVTEPEKAESELNLNENENETVSKEENQEKEYELNMPEEVQVGGNDITSSEDANIKESSIDQHIATVVGFEERKDESAMTKEILKEEEAEDKSIDAQEASKQYESGANETTEQKPEECVNNNENTEEIKPSVETKEKEQVDVIEIDDGQKEDSIKEVCEETHSEKVKFEGVKVSEKDEYQEKEQEHIISGEDKEKDDVTCLQDATSIEDLPETKHDGEGKEPEFVKPRESIEEDTEDIKSSVETKDDIKIEEETIVNDDDQTKKSESLLTNEIVNEEENQEKEKELKMLEEVQGSRDDVLSLQNVSSEDIKETKIGQHATTMTYFKEGQNQSAIDAQEDKKEQKAEESDSKIVQSCSEIKQEEDTEEIKPSVETESQVESAVNEVCEETGSEKVKYSEDVKETTNEKEIESKIECEEGVKATETFKDEDREKDRVDMSPKDQGEDIVTSSQVVVSEDDLQKKNYQEEGKEPEFVKTRESIEEDTEEIEYSIEKNENMEQQGLLHVITTDVCSSTGTELKEETMENEEKIEEEAIVNDDGQTYKSESPLAESELNLNENEIVSKEENQEKEHELKMPEEVQCGGDDVTSSEDANIKESTIGQHVTTMVGFEERKDESALTKEILKEEAEEDKSIDAQEANKQYDQNGAKYKIEENPEESANIILQEEYAEEIKPSVETDEKEQHEVCEETELKKTVSEEGIKLPDSSDMYPNEKEIETLSKDEYQEKEQELNMPEKDQGEDVVAASEEDLKVNEHEFVETRESMKEDNEVIRTNVEETTETEEKNKEPIESDEGQMETSIIHSVKEVCDETSLETVESEKGVKAIETLKDEDQEKDEVNMSEEGQGDDNVRSSQVAALEEDLQKKNYQDQGKEPEFVEIRESIEEDTKEIKSSVETIETETMENEENEEKIEEEAVVNDDGQTEKSESSLVKEVCEVTGLEKAESDLNDDETVIKEENQEKEKEKEKDLKVSEEVQDGGDDVTSSQNASSKDVKETLTGQHATTVAYIEEVPQSEDSNMKEECLTTATHVDEEKGTETKEISSEEIEQVPSETQKKKGTNDLKEQILEEDSHSTELQEKSSEDQKAHVISYSDPSEIDESPKQALESVCDIQTSEVVADSEDSKLKEESIVSETAEYTDKKNGEEEHEVRTNEISIAENVELHGELKPTSELVIEEEQVMETKPQPEQSNITSGNIMENIILTSNEKELTDEVSSELGQPKWQIVDEFTKKDENLLHDSIEDPNDSTTKEEKCFQDVRTREIEPFEEHNDGLDEASKEKSTDLNKTSDVEPNSENAKAESNILPIEDRESVHDVQISEVGSKSEDSNLKEDCLTTSATEAYVEEEKETLTKEISNDEKTEQTTEIGEHDSLYEKRDVKEDVSYLDPLPVGISETTESKQVAEHASISSLDAVLIEENLEHGELKPTSELVIAKDQVKETKPEPIHSDINSETIMKHTSEKDLVDEKKDMEEDVTIAHENQNETNVILTDKVEVDPEKEKENNEIKEQVSKEDICPIEIDQTSTSNQKELADEVEYSKPIADGNNEVKAESPTEKDDELISEIQTPQTALEMEMKEEHLDATNDTCETLMDGSLSEKKHVSMVPPEELTSSTAEDQINELVLETDKTKVDHSSISNKDQNLQFTEEEFPKISVTEEKTLEEDANMEKETVDESTNTTSESRGYADIHKLEEKPTEVFETASEVVENLPEKVHEASSIEKNEPETSTIEEITSEVAGIDVQKHEKALNYTTEAITVDAVSTKEARLESINQENQSEQKKEEDEKIERRIAAEKEPVELDAQVTTGTVATEKLEISQKNITDDLVKISQTQPEIQKHEGSACIADNQSKGNSEVTGNLIEEREIALTIDQQAEDKEETGEKGAKTDEENEEDDDEDNQMSDAPVMVEASKDIEIKAHKKSHNILSGVGSKVKHSIAKVKKAITGKSSHPKPSSPKEKDQVIT